MASSRRRIARALRLGDMSRNGERRRSYSPATRQGASPPTSPSCRSCGGRAQRSAADCGAPGWQDSRLCASGIKQRTRTNPNKLKLYPERYAHIWEGDYARAFDGAYFARHLEEARQQGRIGHVAVDPILPVKAFFDIGGAGHSSDATDRGRIFCKPRTSLSRSSLPLAGSVRRPIALVALSYLSPPPLDTLWASPAPN
jgi:hypothetical protein